MLSMDVQAQDMARVRQVIDTLCHPSMHGRGYSAHRRGYTLEGDRVAAQYLEQTFQEIGLEPFEDSYAQYFPLNINTFPHRVQLKIDKTKLLPGQDYLVQPISQAGKGSAKIIRLDTAIFQNDSVREAFLEQNIPKRVLIYQSQDLARIIDLPQKSIDRLYQAKALVELKSTKLVASLSNRQLSPPIFEIPQEKFEAILQSSPRKKHKIRFKLDAELKRNYKTQNIIGYLPGTAKPDSFIVFSAHYDHLGRMGEDTYFPGANDNASGISMLLELARYYAHPANRPVYSIAFMAFGAEEAGLVGSRFYVENPLFPLKNIKFLMNVDLVGTGDDGATVVNGSIFKEQMQRLRAINARENYLPEIKSRGLAANSDHFYFTENGVPSFFLYTLGGIKAYHDIYDRPETLPLTRYEQVFRLIRDFINQL